MSEALESCERKHTVYIPLAMATWDPAEYARSSAAQLKWANELMSRLALKGNEALLDLGCGDGKITAALAQAVPRGRVVGIDNSEEMIRYAQSRYSASRHPNLAFRLLDVTALDFAAEFDVVFSNAALHWVQDHRAILAGAYRALRREGRLMLSFGGKGNAASILKVASMVGLRPEYFRKFQNPYFFYGPDEYERWLREAGFTAARAELVPKDMVHQGLESLLAWIRTTWMPLTGRVPDERREDFIRELTSAYLKEHPADGEGNLHVHMVRLEVEATKS
jgi:trans-aconitate methyltransferase